MTAPTQILINGRHMILVSVSEVSVLGLGGFAHRAAGAFTNHEPRTETLKPNGMNCSLLGKQHN